MSEGVNNLDNKTIGDLAMTVHQLRAPLTLIRWKLELLFSKSEYKHWPLKSKTQLHHIHDHTMQMLQLVNNLLKIAKVEQGRAEQDLEEINVISFINKIVKKFRTEADQKQITIRVSKPKKPICKLYVDRTFYRMIIENLISNAIKYNYSKGKVTIRVEQVDGYVRLIVADTGIGITKKEQLKLFTKFFRTRYALHNDILGSGLGLYIAKIFLDQCGGKIWLKSSFRHGSTFYVDVPCKQDRQLL